MIQSWIKIAASTALFFVFFGSLYNNEVFIKKTKKLINKVEKINKNKFSYVVAKATKDAVNLNDYHCQTTTTNSIKSTFDCTILKINPTNEIFGDDNYGKYIILNQEYLNSLFAPVNSKEDIKKDAYYVVEAPDDKESEIKTNNTTITIEKNNSSEELATLTVVASNFGKINDIKINGAITKKTTQTECNDCTENYDLWQYKYDSESEECDVYEQKTVDNHYMFTSFGFKKSSFATMNGYDYKTIKFRVPKKILDLKNKTINFFVKKNSSDSFIEMPHMESIFDKGIIGNFGENIFPKILVE